MTAIARGELDRFLEKPDPRKPIVLIYGPDAGLVAERAAQIAARSIGAPIDSFNMLKLDGDEIASDPLRLVDEANTASLFGGRRALRVRVGSRNIAAAVEPLTKTPPIDATVVLEAGDLKKSAPLRALCEKSPNAAAIACYSDDANELRRLIDQSLAAASLTIDRDARDALMGLLGGDRLASRGEIDKLIAYASGSGAVTIDDIEAVVGDAADAATSEAIDGAFSGDPATMLPALGKLLASGERPDGVLIAALNHGWLLVQGMAQVESGQPARSVAERAIPYFKRRAAFERQLQIWRREDALAQLRQIGESILAARAQADMARSLLDRTLLRIALTARRARN